MQIKQSEIGLVYKKGQFLRLLTTGEYNMYFVEIEIYQLNERFVPKSTDLNILLADKTVTDELNIIDVKETEICIRFEKGELKEILKAGKYAYWKNGVDITKFETFQLNAKFEPKLADFNTLVQIPALAELMQVVEVKEHEICFHFVDNVFRELFRAGKHAFWKTQIKREFQIYDISNPQLPEGFNKHLVTSPLFKLVANTFVVEPFEKGLFFINKEFQGLLNPGYYHFWKSSREVQIDKVDMRQQQLEIAGQEIMSKDKVTLRFNFVCQYKIKDPQKAILEIKNYSNELYILLQLVLREYVGGFTLDEILLKKQEIGDYVTQNLKDKAENLGLNLIFAGVKDVILPGDIKDILNQVLIAEKKAQANVIMRREETASTRSLLNTAKLMEENELLFKLKELEYIERISEKINQISISGGSQILEQLKQIFVSLKDDKDKKTEK